MITEYIFLCCIMLSLNADANKCVYGILVEYINDFHYFFNIVCESEAFLRKSWRNVYSILYA